MKHEGILERAERVMNEAAARGKDPYDALERFLADLQSDPRQRAQLDLRRAKTAAAAHHVRFLRSTHEAGLYRAVCTCGWSIEGALAHVQMRAATHDLDQRWPDEKRREPSGGFTSGLPDDQHGKRRR